MRFLVQGCLASGAYEMGANLGVGNVRLWVADHLLRLKAYIVSLNSLGRENRTRPVGCLVSSEESSTFVPGTLHQTSWHLEKCILILSL